jgi:hypothetical protein
VTNITTPNLDEVVTGMMNNMKEDNNLLNDPNFKPPKSSKSPQIEEPKKPIK